MVVTRTEKAGEATVLKLGHLQGFISAYNGMSFQGNTTHVIILNKAD